MVVARWEPPADMDSLYEYEVDRCKEVNMQEEVVKISESVHPFDTTKLEEETVVEEITECEVEEEGKEETPKGGKDNLGLED